MTNYSISIVESQLAVIIANRKKDADEQPKKLKQIV
jgi:hypothetical protein